MRKLLIAAVALAAGLVLTAEADAHGRRGGSSGCGDYSAAYVGGGFGSYGAVAPMPYAPPQVTWTEQKVTAYKTVVKTREVKREVTRPVTKKVEEPYTYWECVATTTPEKRFETICRLVTKEVPFTYCVNVPVYGQEKRKVQVMTTVGKEVPYSYTVNVPVHTKQKVKQTVMQCVQEEVVRQIPVCRFVSERCVDPCTGCVYTVCRRVTEIQTIKGMASKWVPTVQEVEAMVCTWQAQERKGVRTVYECVPQEREVLVNTCTWQAQERKGARIVCETVAEKREVTVNVVRYQNVEKKGTRTRLVCEWVKETVPVTECYTEQVAYETTVRVPVYTGAVDCGPYYGAGFRGDSGGHGRGGFFRGGRHGCR